MIELPLTLRLTPAPVRPAAAWFIPGVDARAWLPRLIDHFPNADLALYILPTSRQDRTPAGLLAVAPAEKVRTHAPTMMPFGRHLNLYLPVDAVLWPPVTDAELSALLHFEINVFHPAIGLVGFSPTDRVHLSQLIAPPARRPADWSRAAPGIPPMARLTSVLPLLVPGPQDILEEGRDDIGELAPQDAPPQPNESTAGTLAKTIAVAPIAAAAALLKAIADRLRPGPGRTPPPSAPGNSGKRPQAPGKAPASGGIRGFLADAISKGAAALNNLTPHQFSKLAAALESRRQREVNRLLSLLERDPDEGLRYALPLGGSSRGLTTPGDRLGPRDTNFSLSGVNSSGAADPWNLSFDVQQKLRDHYRKLATRELALGRHRRAAYIFAQLLGDLSAAANALRQGGHFREAAVLYRERLANRAAAADCLREGGLLLEAIELYQELRMFEHVGDLYTQLEQHDKAEAAYRAVVQQLVLARNYLKAAAFLEERLHAPREALAVLDDPWPNSPSGPACLAESFRLLARLKDFPEAQRRVRMLRSNVDRAPSVPVLARVLADVAAAFPEATTQHLAADATRVIIGDRLADAPHAEACDLVRLLPALAPADQLLRRDTERFARTLIAPASLAPIVSKPPDPHRRKPLHELKVLRTFQLHPEIDWKGFAPAQAVFFGIGLRDGHWIALRSDFSGNTDLCGLGFAPLDSRIQPSRLLYCSRPPTFGSAFAAVTPAAEAHRLLPSVQSPAVTFGFPWLPAHTVAIAADEQQNIWALHFETEDAVGLALSVYDPETRNVLSTHAVPCDPALLGNLRLHAHLVVRFNHAYIGLGSTLKILTYGSTWRDTEFGRPITHMTASDPLSRARVAVAFTSGGVVYSNGLEEAPFAEGLDSPVLCFTRGGSLVAASASEIRVYGFDDKSPQLRHIRPGLTKDTVTPGAALLPTPRMDEIAIISASGKVQIVQVVGA